METTFEIAKTFLTEGRLTDRKRKTLDFFSIKYPSKKLKVVPIEDLKVWNKRKREKYPLLWENYLKNNFINPENLKVFNKRKREYLGLPLELGSYNGGIDFIREIVRTRDNHRCQKCFKKWIQGTRKFDVHHLDIKMESTRNINYDRKNIDKMITYCHKCHLNIHTVRNKMVEGKKVIHRYLTDTKNK